MRPAEEFLPKKTIALLQRQHYSLFGHSAVKLCHWTKLSLTQGKQCYKQKFYGISSHRCMQLSPSVSFCEQQCVFCWRPFTETSSFPKQFVEPQEIVDAALEAQRRLLSGFGALEEKIGKKKLEEAMQPKHAAISLSGEPTLYPKLSGLIEEFGRRGMTTFLVSNGLHPEVISKMALPTQLYVSLVAPDKQTHKKINSPLLKDSWERINRSLELFPSLDTRKAIRITLVKGYNMLCPEKFSKLIEKSRADFVELKAFMFVGFSRQRLREENMPLHSEVKEFAEKVNKHLNYDFLGEAPESRVVCLSSGAKEAKIRFD